MSISMSTFFADEILNAASPVDVAAAIGGGTLVMYSGTPPASADAALSGNTVLATWTFSASGSQGAASAKSMTPSLAATAVTAAATGTATMFRIIDSASNVLLQGSVGTSGADMNLSSTGITSGDTVNLSGSNSITFP